MTSFCNFCLKPSNACISVDKTLEESIELIFMNIEFVIAECSQICKECIQRVNSAFDFKAASICNEDFIVSFETDIPWTEKLIDVYLEKNKIKVDICRNELKICRFCITMVFDNNYCLLEDSEVDTNVREVIKIHLPEVAASICNEDFIVSFETDIPWTEKLIDVYLEKNKIKVDICRNELKICRFCITMVFDNNYYLLEDSEVDTNVREVIKIHLPEVAASICNEDFIVSFETDIPWTEKLIDVYLEKNKIKVDICRNELKICRFCITMVFDNNYYLLEDSEVDTNVREVIKIHLPEVDFTITNNPIVCKTCLTKLQDYGLFINSWLDIYNRIKNCCSNNKSDISDLNAMRKLIFENSKEEIFTKAIQNGEERNEKSRDCVVDKIQFEDDIEVHDTKYPTEGEQIKTQSFSNDVQLRNNDFEIEESNLKTETLHFESKMELDNFVLKEEEIFIDDESKVFEECSGINLNTKTLHNDNQGLNQQIFNELSSSEDTVPLETSKNRKLDSSFFMVSLPKMKQNRLSLTKQSVGQLMASRNRLYHQPIKINNGFKCGLCPFQNKLEARVKDHFENSHYSNEFTKQLGVELFKCLYCAHATHCKEHLKNHSKIHFSKTKNNFPEWHVKKDCDKDEEFLKRQLIVHSDGCKLYKCQHCDFRTKYRSSLKQHLLVHSDAKSFYKCQHCDYKTKYKHNLKTHLLGHSDENVFYKCEHCDYKTKYKQSLKYHLIVHSDDNVLYKCEHCDYKTKRKGVFKNHLIVHSDVCQLYKCEHCDFKTKYKSNLKQHLSGHSDAKGFFKCQHCDYKTEYKDHLKTHLIEHSDENVFYKCEHCDFKSKFKSYLKSHLMVHSDENVVYKCEHCDFKSKYMRSLKRHLIVHSDENDVYKCELCDFKSKFKGSLKSHLMVHSDENVVHKCEHCDFKTKYKNSLKSHLMVHSDENVFYKCDHCGYKTKYKKNLKSHLIVHSNENVLYKCEHCDHKTKHKYSLKNHLLVHSNENVFNKCEYCNYKTKYMYSLKKHLIVHSDENVFYKCEHCDFKTKYKSNLKQHLSGHSNAKGFYKCKHCDYNTKYKHDLKSHLIVHSDENVFYECEHCDCKTMYKNVLKRHLEMHSNDDVFYRCKDCDFKTKHMRSLKRHLIVHSN